LRKRVSMGSAYLTVVKAGTASSRTVNTTAIHKFFIKI
jgi:hypothetical protein